MTGCEQFWGRRKAICEGTADGVPLVVTNNLRATVGLEPLAKPEPAVRSVSVAPNPPRQTPQKRGWGDAVSSALSVVGITEERVSAWIGADCGCAERREKLNKLGFWAERVLAGHHEPPPIP